MYNVVRMRHANTLFFLSPEFFTNLLSLTHLLTVSTKLYTKSIIVLKIHQFPVWFHRSIPSEYLFFSRLSQANIGHFDSSPCINLLSPICCKQNSHVRVYTHCQDVADDSPVAVMYCLDALMALQGPTTTTHLLFLLNSCQFFQTLFCHHLVLHSVYFKTVSGLILQ